MCPVEDEAVSDVAEKVESEEDGMISGRNRSDIDYRGKLDLTVVTVLPQGSVRNVSLNKGPPGRLVPRPERLL